MLESGLERLSKLIGFADNNAARLRSLTDRTLGDRPPEGGKNPAPTPVRCGTAGVLVDRLDEMDAALQRQAADIERLETFI